MATFLCPKCETPLTGEVNERNDTTCQNPKCRRRWRLNPDRQSIMGAKTVLAPQSVRQAATAKNVGGKHG